MAKAKGKYAELVFKTFGKPWYEWIVCYAAAKMAEEQMSRICLIPAIVLRIDGRIDPRRYRRYVTKHRKIIKLNAITVDL